MFALAHLSDPHLAPMPAPRFSDLASKRLLGFLNWQRKRRDIHRYETLERLVADMRAQNPDHIAVTGDLINIALPEEFPMARMWLAGLGAPGDVTLVAGNHDAYVRSMQHEPVKQWADYMRGDDANDVTFPFVRKRGRIAIVGLSTAVAAPLHRATGRLGKDQLARLGSTLKQLGENGLFRIVSLHHPPASEPSRYGERLIDGAPLIEVLAEAGAELVIHGHEHVLTVSWFDGPGGKRIPAVGVPSASAAPGGRWEPAGYNVYRITGAPGGWRCEMISRSLGDGGTVREVGRRVLVQP
jgi:3',5'-cyclic AMP phosphodiesterase CpdA